MPTVEQRANGAKRRELESKYNGYAQRDKGKQHAHEKQHADSQRTNWRSPK